METSETPQKTTSTVASATAVAAEQVVNAGGVVPTSNNTAVAAAATAAAPACANVVTIPVPIVQNEDYYTYVTVKGSLHDRSCTVFGLNEAEIQALSKRFENSVKPAVNGFMIAVSPMEMVNTLAQLSYKVVCSCGEAEICWTMQREI